MTNTFFFVYEFPPVHTTGAMRPLKFIKYMRDFGINPIIITTDIESGKRAFSYAKIDNNILKEIADDIEIIRIPTENFNHFYTNKLRNTIHHYFSISDHIKTYWGKNVNKEIGNLINQYNPIIIYATAPPFGVASIASKIAKKFNLHWLWT